MMKCENGTVCLTSNYIFFALVNLRWVYFIISEIVSPILQSIQTFTVTICNYVSLYANILDNQYCQYIFCTMLHGGWGLIDV
jgi:hypothetical protein